MTKEVKPYIILIHSSLQVLVERMPKNKEAFLSDEILQDATLMRLLEAGENFIRIRDQFPDYYEEHYSDSWTKIIGLRSVIAHGYTFVKMSRIWQIVKDDVPPLLAELERLA